MTKRMYESLTVEEKQNIYDAYVLDKNSIDATVRITKLTYGLVYKYLVNNNLIRPKKEAVKIMKDRMNEGKYTNQRQRILKG